MGNTAEYLEYNFHNIQTYKFLYNIAMWYMQTANIIMLTLVGSMHAFAFQPRKLS